jgi:uncharacterized membrane protein
VTGIASLPTPTEVSDPAAAIGQTAAHLRHAHRQESGVMQRGVDRVTGIIGWPGSVVWLGATMISWIVANLAAERLGYQPVDPPPFAGLEFIAASGALVVAMLILTTQRREDRLADHRAQLILELSIANDQKIAKIIGLLEESRRDNPAITDRVDDLAAAMSTPSDTAAVIGAIKDLSDDPG